MEDAPKRGVTWLTEDLLCPKCGSHDIVGFLLVDEDGTHQHTKYRCTRWNRERAKPCDWEGWSVPGWESYVPLLCEIRRAIKDPGSHPEHHLATMERHRAEWPVLWAALEALLGVVQEENPPPP